MLRRPPRSTRTYPVLPNPTLFRSEGRGIFGGVAHDLDMAEALGLERLSDRPDAAVHHVAGRDDVGAGARLIQRLSHQYLDRLVVENIARAVDQPVLPMTGIGRSEEHTSELQSLMRISYAVFCL